MGRPGLPPLLSLLHIYLFSPLSLFIHAYLLESSLHPTTLMFCQLTADSLLNKYHHKRMAGWSNRLYMTLTRTDFNTKSGIFALFSFCFVYFLEIQLINTKFSPMKVPVKVRCCHSDLLTPDKVSYHNHIPRCNHRTMHLMTGPCRCCRNTDHPCDIHQPNNHKTKVVISAWHEII